jgi:putative phosphoesterase
MKIGLISDVHAEPAPLAEALALFRDQGVGTILCAGDIVGYGSDASAVVTLLKAHDVCTVLGNHDLWLLQHFEAERNVVCDYLRTLPLEQELRLAGKELLMLHASPGGGLLDGIRLLDEDGRLLASQRDLWTTALKDLAVDVLVVGHTHQLFSQQLGEVLVINPGSTLFNHSCAILELPQMTLTIHPLSGRQPLLSWNFSLLRAGGPPFLIP